MPPTQNAIELISTFLEPNPVVYSRLSMVNKEFNAVFTSDTLWARLDVYGKQKNIHRHFLDHLPTFEGIIRACWHGLFFKDGFNVENVDNMYAQLGYYACGATRVGFYLCRDNGLDDETTVKSSDLKFLRLLFDINPHRIKDISHKLRDNKDFIWNLSLNYPNVLMYTPETIQKDAEFMSRLVDAYIERDQPVDFLSDHSPAQTIDHAIEVIPKHLLLNHSFMISRKSRFKEIVTSRENLLPYIRGNPHFLDTFPEYWSDSEICLAALEYNPRVQEWWLGDDIKFLKDCQDNKIIATALKNYPISILSVPSKYRSPSAVKYALRYGQTSLFLNLYDLEHDNVKLFSDPEIIAIYMDQGYYEGPTEYPAPKALEPLCDNLLWMKERVSINPESWKYASEQLKRNKYLFLLATKVHKPEPDNQKSFGYRKSVEYLQLPECFWQDQELIQELVELEKVCVIPKHLQTDQMVKQSIACGDDFSEEGYPYELVRAAVLYDVTQIRQCRKNVVKLAQDPDLASFIKSHIYDIDWECLRGGPEFVFGNKPDWAKIDRQSALRFFTRDCHRYQQITEKWIDIDFVEDAVRTDGRVFGYLEEQFKNNKTIQVAIGPFSDAKV